MKLAKEHGKEAERFFKEAGSAAERGDCNSAWDKMLIALGHEGKHRAHRYSAPRTETGRFLNKELHFSEDKALFSFQNKCLVRK